MGAGTSHSWGNRDLTGESTQALADSVVQASEAIRSLRSTVIIQSRQAERDSIETRTVTNYNQSKAMTVQYYEVLRHFEVETLFSESQPVVFIPYIPIRFDRETAKRFRHILIRHLLDPRANEWFNALERANELNNRPVGGGEALGAEDDEVLGKPANAFIIDRLQISLKTGDQQTIGSVKVLFGLKDGSWVLAGEVPSRELLNTVLRKNDVHTFDTTDITDNPYAYYMR